MDTEKHYSVLVVIIGRYCLQTVSICDCRSESVSILSVSHTPTEVKYRGDWSVFYAGAWSQSQSVEGDSVSGSYLMCYLDLCVIVLNSV